MSPTGNNTHKFAPNGDVLLRGEFVVSTRKVLWFFTVTRTVFRLSEEHTYDGPIYHIKAPANYETDGATVPRILWWLVERYGKAMRPALHHDILYDRRIGTKVAADAAFLEMLLVDGVNRLLATLMFLAVLLWPGNWLHWYRPPRKLGTGWKKRQIF